jgi:DUF1365 family protein
LSRLPWWRTRSARRSSQHVRRAPSLPARASGRPRPHLRGNAAGEQVFHVSPFCPVSGHYRFRFHFGPARWLARIDYHDNDTVAEPLLETWISGEPRPLARATTAGLLWRYRWFTLGVIARIHWQAIRLWTKRVPFFSKPSPPATLTTR